MSVKIRFYSLLSLVFIFVAACSVMFWVAFLCQYGIDITDEGMSLVTIANPKMYPSVTQFGLFYAPLYSMVHGDIVLLRIINLVLLVLVSTIFIAVTFRKVGLSLRYFSLQWFVISTAVALVSLIYLNSWQPTPSYNSLNLIAMIVAAIATLAITDSQDGIKCNFLLVLLGFAGSIVFLTKGTSAVVLCIAVIFYLVVSRSLSIYRISIISFASIAMIVSTALLLDGSIVEFISRLNSGWIEGNILTEKGFGLMNLLWKGEFRSEPLVWTYLAVLTLVISTAMVLCCSKIYTARMMSSMIIISFITYCVLVIFNLLPNYLVDAHFSRRIWIVYSLVFSLLIAGLWIRFTGIKSLVHNQSTAMVIFLLLLPYGFAVGTNSSYFYIGSNASIFIVGACIAIVPVDSSRSLNLRRYSVFGICLVLVVFLLIHASIQKPYRQPGERLSNDTVKTSILTFGTRLKLPIRTERYFQSLRDAAKNNGFLEGTEVIDLTGASPGSLHALGAKSLGAAWLIGGYEGSFDRAVYALNRVDIASINRAWLLIEMDYNRSISADLLSHFGKKIETDYKLVAQVILPKELGGRQADAIQELYKPIDWVESHE